MPDRELRGDVPPMKPTWSTVVLAFIAGGMIFAGLEKNFHFLPDELP